MHSLLINSFFPFGLQYVSTIILGTSKEIHFLHWRFQCLGNNNVCSTYLDWCKLRSYVYLANLCDKLGDSRYVLNIVNVYPYNSCVCLLIAVICSSVIFCLFVFVLAYLFNCFIPNLEIQIVDQPFCKKKNRRKSYLSS